ncbi:MAG: ABC transporter substrate-binding protein [Thermomicrobiales bacterium]|nr:ABC transporter substrate-binding protein [Thermomicrobiales bacterium]
MSLTHRFTRRRLLATGAALTGGALIGRAGFAPGMASAQDATPEAPRGGIVRFARANPSSLNPLFSTAGIDQGVETQVYGALVIMNYNTAPQLDLAKAIDATPDALSFTFTIDETRFFSDGTPLTSADFIFTFERAINPASGSFWGSRFKNIVGADGYDGSGPEAITGMTAPDEQTISFSFVAPDATFLVVLGDFAGFCVLPKHIWEEIAPADLLNHPYSLAPTIGAGPFIFNEYISDQHISLSRNDSYDPPLANIDQLLLPIVPSSATQQAQLLAGELDIKSLTVTDIASLDGQAHLSVYNDPSVQLRSLVPNVSRPAFADKRVRQAMQWALDREGLAQELYQGYASTIESPFFAWEWPDGQAAVPEPRGYDPDKARALLAEAGWNSSDYQIQFHYIPDNGFDDTLLTLIHDMYSDVGINYELVQVDVTEYNNRVIAGAPADGSSPGDFDLVLLSGGVMGGDPNLTARYFDTASRVPFGANYGHYSNARLDELYIAGRGTTDVEERMAIYTEAAAILNDEAPWVFLFRLPALYGVNNRVKNFNSPGHVGRVVSSAHTWWVEEA